MHTSYWFGTSVGDLLFQGFTISSVPGFISTCFGVLSLAVLFEALKVGLVSARQQAAQVALNVQTDRCPNEASLLLLSSQNERLQSNSKKLLMIFNQLVLFTTHEVFSYLLMLLVMTYNGYFTVAASLGAGIGFFIFSPALMEISLRRGGTMHYSMHCATCIEKSKQMEEKDEEITSLRDVAEGVAQIVFETVHKTSTRDNCETTDDEPHCSIEVALVHSTNEVC